MSNPLQEAIEFTLKEALLGLHTSFLGRVEKLYRAKNTPNDAPPDRVDVSPLHMYQRRGNSPQDYPLLLGLPILNGAQFVATEFNEDSGHITYALIKPGATVLCVCCEREISAALTGDKSLPSKQWHHSMTDAVVIGVINHQEVTA